MDAKVLREFWVTRGLSLEQLGQPSHKEAEWLANHLEAMAGNLEREVAILTASVGAISPTEENHLELVCRDYDRSVARCEYLSSQAGAYRRRAKLHRLSASTDGYRLVDNIREARQKVEYFDNLLSRQIIPVELLSINITLTELNRVAMGEQTLDQAIENVLIQEGKGED
jgi:hypothetical protein